MDLEAQSFLDVADFSPAGRIDHSSAAPFQESLLLHLDECTDAGRKTVLDLSAVE